MNDETPPSKLIYSLWKAGHHSFEKAEAVQDQLFAAASALKKNATDLPDAMARHLDTQLPDAASKAAKMIASKWTEANLHADQATRAYRQATADARQLVFGATIAICCIVACALVALALWILPSWEEVARMQQQKAELEATIKLLNKQGGQANVYSWTDNRGRVRLCIRVDESVKPPQGMRVIKGY
jgi:hypothetical protein